MGKSACEGETETDRIHRQSNMRELEEGEAKEKEKLLRMNREEL